MPDNFLPNLLLNIPPDGGALPHVTPAMLLDAFDKEDVLLVENASDDRVLRWFISSSQLGVFDEESSPVPLSQLLVMAPVEEVVELAERYPQAFFMSFDRDGKSMELLCPYGQRMLVVRKDGSSLSLLMKVQDIFVRMLLWESNLARIVQRDGALEDLLDASVPMMGNFIFVSDNDFNVIARTSLVDPPDDLHRGIIEKGCLTQHTIDEKRFRLPEETFYTRKASELTPYDRVSYPVHLQHSYFGSISMSCCGTSDTVGLRDLFHILVEHMLPLCERIWTRQTAYDAPSYFIISKLLHHEPLSDEYLFGQLKSNRLPSTGHFKVIVFDVDPGVNPDLAYGVMRQTQSLNGRRVKCFPHEHCILALLYDDGRDGTLSHRRTVREVNEIAWSEQRVDCGISSVFGNIRDIDLAYQQARIALGFRGAIDSERMTSDDQLPQGIYLFEDALLYYLVDSGSHDERFMEFTFSNSFITVLWSEDLDNGTNYLSLLWFYLQSERNATDTAAKLHMHRNTVLYHIDKIQKRFDFDMDKKSARDWLLLNFKSFFAHQSRESLDAIIDPAEIQLDDGR